MYALIISGKKVNSSLGSTMAEEGERFLVINESEGWVEATSVKYIENGFIRSDAKLFKSVKQAKTFANRWKGHPWWCVPNGKFEIIKLKSIYKKILDKYGFVRKKYV